MKCKKCGSEFDGNFCPNCGARVSENLQNSKLLNVISIISFVIGAFFIFANHYFIFYGVALILFGVLEIILNKYKTFMKVNGMIHLTLALFSMFDMFKVSALAIVFVVFLPVSIIYLIKGFK